MRISLVTTTTHLITVMLSRAQSTFRITVRTLGSHGHGSKVANYPYALLCRTRATMLSRRLEVPKRTDAPLDLSGTIVEMTDMGRCI
jgi:hypothetical protein